jgi:hypothetical protein
MPRSGSASQAKAMSPLHYPKIVGLWLGRVSTGSALARRLNFGRGVGAVQAESESRTQYRSLARALQPPWPGSHPSGIAIDYRLHRAWAIHETLCAGRLGIAPRREDPSTESVLGQTELTARRYPHTRVDGDCHER